MLHVLYGMKYGLCVFQSDMVLISNIISFLLFHTLNETMEYGGAIA